MKEGWTYKKLGEVATFARGLTYSKNDEVEQSNNIVLRSNNIDLIAGKLDFSELKYLKAGFAIPEEKRLRKGSLFICMSNGSKAHLGKVAYVDKDYGYAFGGFMGQITPNHDVDGLYLHYALTSPLYKDYIKSLSEGANINNLKYKDLAEFVIKYPSLSEQQSIVDYLDSAFAKIDAMKANAEKALNEAKALFQASLKEMLEPKEGWEEKKLCEVVNIINGYAFPSKAFGDNQELKVVKITNVGVGTFIEDISTLPNKMFIQDVCLKEGDIVIALTRTIISDGLKRAIIPSSYDGAMLNQRVASLRYSGNINMSFLYYYLGCSLVSDYVWLHVNTLMQPNLSIKDLKDLPVCNPPFSEQQSIVTALDSLKSKVDRLQENFNKISQECDALKQAILRQVFE